MSEDDRRAVRPRWICGAVGEGVEQDNGDWEEYATRLKKAVKAKSEGPREEVEEIEGEGEEENGQRKTKRMLDPKLPSPEEVRQHNLTHMPYRNWCPHCVRGRGKEMDHKKKKDTNEQDIPEYHLDYCFPGDEEGEKLTILVVVEKETKMKKAVVVPSKGSTGRYAAKMVLELIAECGDKDRPILLKSDQEPAILYLIDDVSTSRTGAKTLAEQAPKRSKGSNGVVERAV